MLNFASHKNVPSASVARKSLSLVACAGLTAILSLIICVATMLQAVAAEKVNLINTPQDFSKQGLAKRIADDEVLSDGTQQTLNLNFSPEDRLRLRKALDDFSRTVDPGHDQIIERRRSMQESIKERFLTSDKDNDGSLDRQEATESLPQVARHFGQVDSNQDGLITLDELQSVQLKNIERRKAAEAAMELQKSEEFEAATNIKRKNKQASNNPRKNSL